MKPRVNVKWDQRPETTFKNQLSTIKVDLIDAPTYTQLLRYIPEFGEATWEDEPRTDYTDAERRECVRDMFRGKYVPTAMETVGITIRLRGIDITDVTHFLRHRLFSFSAQCSGDRDMRHDPVMVKASIHASKFLTEYISICVRAKDLYARMVDSKRIPILDARSILPRNTETFYYIRGPLGIWLDFIRQRTDIQIQPKSDVVIAIKVYEALCDLYPPLKGMIDITGPDPWYLNTVNTKRSSNMMAPRECNDTFEWEPEDFVYGSKTIGDFPGDDRFLEILKKHREEYHDGVE